MTIRMKDIAKDLGISQATVSKVLREHPDIGEETRRRVLERVKELDYQPNSLARSLVTGRSYLIGLVAPSLLHPFFAQIAKSLSNEIRNKGYSLIVSSSEEDPELEREEISRLLARRLDALVVASSGANLEQFQRMDSKAQPYVLIDRDLAGLAANFVGINDEKVGRLATEHLINIGCRRVAHIRGRKTARAPAESKAIGGHCKTTESPTQKTSWCSQITRIPIPLLRARRPCACSCSEIRGLTGYFALTIHWQSER